MPVLVGSVTCTTQATTSKRSGGLKQGRDSKVVTYIERSGNGHGSVGSIATLLEDLYTNYMGLSYQKRGRVQG
jgi:hypothetical protein